MQSHHTLDAHGLVHVGNRTPIPGPLQTVADLISHYDDGHREALVGKSRTLTCQQLEAEVDAAAAAYEALGLKPGDRIAATGPSDCDMAIAFFASQRGGFVWVGLNKSLAGPEKLFVVEDCGARLVLADADALAQMQGQLGTDVRALSIDGAGPQDWPAMAARHRGSVRPAVSIDAFAPAAIAYTSGTTGKPKGAVHSQHNMMTVTLACHQLIGSGNWQRGLRRAVGIPITILNGMIYGPLAALAGQGTCVFLDRLDVASIIPVIESRRVEALGASSTTVFDMMHGAQRQGKPVGSLRWMWAGGSFVAEDLKAEFRAAYGSHLIEDYGLTEAPTSIVSGRADEKAPAGCVGYPHPHLRVRALGPDGAQLPPGEVGEIAVRATDSGSWAGVYTPMLGYWNQPQETAICLQDGWLLTGDLGYLDEQGRVYIAGRKKEVIIRGGANVYPAEIERVLKGHALVEDAVVMGQPDARLGEIVAAYLHLRAPIGEAAAIKDDLIARCKTQLAIYKVPERWLVVGVIPRNQMRKPIKSELRDGPSVPV
jgi:acyl-CoA synthetase (AMP-forming)/AMP-acid ligase II